MRKIIASFFLIAIVGFRLSAQDNYSNFISQSARLNTLAKNYPKLVQLRSLAKTAGGRDIWQLTIGANDKPAIAIVGGVEGNYLLGTELAIGFAESIVQGSNTDSIKALLSKTCFYIFPNMSPDAMEQYFAGIRYERQGNAAVTDDDRDGRTNEDGVDDLDKNGKITWMRVASAIGEYKTHPDDPRVLVKADIAKGEKGSYRLLPEGIDNDKDGQFNEDGEGGVAFNKNLSFKHPSFTPGAGEFPVSENESRALLDFLFAHFNIYSLISFGSNNNLSTPYTFNSAAGSQPILSSWLEPDTKINSLVSDLYNKVTGFKDAPKTNTAGGDLLSWGYYHYARYSFSTPGWWVPKTKPDSTRNEKAFTVDDPMANYLRWAGQQGISNNYTEWKTIAHPDFPDQKVEVGGIDPFVLTTPPFSLTPELVKKNTQFIVKLAAFQPTLEFADIKTEKLSGGLTRITVSVINTGALSTHSKLGERSYWVKKVNVKLGLQAGQTVVSGKPVQVLNALEGYSSQSISWLIKGSGKLLIEAGSPSTGTKTLDISL